MFRKIKHFSTKILSHFYFLCFRKAGFCKHCRVNRLDLLVSWRLVLLIDKRDTKSKFLKQGLRVCVGENTCEEIIVFFVRGNRFFVGNSRLNCRIIESIFDTSLVYIRLLIDRCHSLQFMSQNFAASISLSRIFVWLHQKCATSNFAISNFRERSCIFRFELHKTSFENLRTFHGKFVRTKDEFQRNMFALLWHNTVAVLML